MLAYYLTTALHILVCIILILVVLLQSGKGADLAGAFGGASTQTAFGSRGPASFLSKLTTAAAVLFMLTSLSLAIMGGKSRESSVLDQTSGTPAPASKAPAAKTEQQAPPTPEEIKRIQEEIETRQKKGPAGSPGTGQSPAPSGEAAPPGPEKKP